MANGVIALTRKLHNNFVAREFVCKCSGKFCNGQVHMCAPAIMLIQSCRVMFNSIIDVTSGVRCQRHNAAVGGSGSSRHMTGEAVDFRIRSHNTGTSVIEAYKRIVEAWRSPKNFNEQVIKEYLGYCYLLKSSGKYNGVIHLDCRGALGDIDKKPVHPFQTDASAVGIKI